MNLLDYIKGNRKGEEAHRIEMDSMYDPFLYEALEGLDSVDDEDHAKRIANIQKSIRKHNLTGNPKITVNYDEGTLQKKRSLHLIWKITVAAAAIFIVILGIELIGSSSENGLQAQNTTQMPIDIYVPDDFYVENIAVIAYKNTELTKSISVTTFKSIDNKEVENTSHTDEVLRQENTRPLKIYIPE